MLRRDHELRLSDEYQARYSMCGDDGAAKELVTGAVQRRVAVEAGFSGAKTRAGVDLLQSASALFPDDAEVRGAAFYLYNNIHVACPLQLGAVVPNVPLHQLPPQRSCGAVAQRTLLEYVAQAPLTVLCAGSAT